MQSVSKQSLKEPPKPKHAGGRPVFRTKKGDGKTEAGVLAKLKQVWAMGGSDEEAGFYAEISIDALQRYYDKHPELKELRERLRQKPVLKSRQTIVGALDQPEHAWRYIKQKRPEEFGKVPEGTVLENHFHFAKDPLDVPKQSHGNHVAENRKAEDSMELSFGSDDE